MNYPILDGSYIYDKIIAKIENDEDINVYEQFYLWSIHNRSKILYGLFILFVSCLIINDITEYRQINNYTNWWCYDEHQKKRFF